MDARYTLSPKLWTYLKNYAAKHRAAGNGFGYGLVTGDMAWSFTKLMDHWKAKHAHAAYVPSQMRKSPEREYRYGKNILLGEGAEFGLFLKAVHEGKLYYDPGIKLEGVSSARPKSKKRSQFRINSKDLPALYESSRMVDACTVAAD